MINTEDAGLTDSRRGRFVCFEGTDGAGKSTIARGLYKVLHQSELPVVLVEKKDAVFPNNFLSEHMGIIKQALWEYPKDAPIETLGNAHWLHLMVSWFSALDFSKIRPHLQMGRWVIVDNWYYKFLARFMLKPEFDEFYLKSCFSHITTPAQVIFLDTPPELAVTRRSHFNPTEMGVLDGRDGKTMDSFINYQCAVQTVLREFCYANRWVSIDTHNLDEHTVVQQAAAAVLEGGV